MKNCYTCVRKNVIKSDKDNEIWFCPSFHREKCLYGEHTYFPPVNKSKVETKIVSVPKAPNSDIILIFIPRFKAFATKKPVTEYWQKLHEKIFTLKTIYENEKGTMRRISKELNIPYSSLLYYVNRYKDSEENKDGYYKKFYK